MESPITISNRAVAEKIGVQAESAIGRSYLDFLTSDGKPQGAYPTQIDGRNLEA